MNSKKEPETQCLWLFLYYVVLHFTSDILTAGQVLCPEAGVLGQVNRLGVSVRFRDEHRCILIRDEYV